ncbi:hypothetical protein B0H11DRAFT_1936658 [Mycena galericulata]|nr:hypothetical protein B0H11DRAFT_1936658 [Mycena galericulata]
MPKVGTKIIGSRKHDGYCAILIRDKPLTATVVKKLSATAKTARGARRAHLMATGATKPLGMWALARGPEFELVDLNLPAIFPRGCYSMRINRVPGTNAPLPTGWRIYFDTGRYPTHVNECVMKKFKMKWMGNILMVRHRRMSNHISHVRSGEEDFANLLLSLWLREFASVRERLQVDIPYAASL